MTSGAKHFTSNSQRRARSITVHVLNQQSLRTRFTRGVTVLALALCGRDLPRLAHSRVLKRANLEGEEVMKMNLFSLMSGFVLLLVAPLAIVSAWGGHAGQRPQEKDEYRLEGPFTQGNLTVFLIHGKDKIKGQTFITLQEALVQGKVIVRETRSVNELSIENTSSEEVFVQSGDIVKGGQQDRMLVVDLILPPRSGKIPIAAFCVENGRWSRRGNEEVTTFNSSSNTVASREVKLAAKARGSQGEVWREVAAAQDKLSANVGGNVKNEASPTSFQLAMENKEVQKTAENYIDALSGIVNSKPDVIGYVFAIN